MEYEEMRAMEKTHICAMCDGELVTAWDAEGNCHRLCCGRDHTHNGFQQRLSPQKALQRGQADKVIQPGAQKDLEKRATENALAFRMLPKEDLGDYHAITLEDTKNIIGWAKMVGLNAFLGHVELYFGMPRVSIDGYYYLAKKQGRYISVAALPAVGEDYDTYKVTKENYLSIAHGWQGGKELHEVGLGIVTQDEITEMQKKTTGKKGQLPIVKYPQRMAEKRAEWQLLRKLIPLEVKE